MRPATDLRSARLAAAAVLQAELASRVPSARTTVRPDGELEVRVEPSELRQAAEVLRTAGSHPLNYLSCVSGVDWPDRGVIEVVYTLHSMPDPSTKASLRSEVARDADPPVLPSLAEVWPTAGFQEREVYDLLGVRFEGHPDLRRILLDESFVGYPLRKDFVDTRPPRRRVTREDYQP